MGLSRCAIRFTIMVLRTAAGALRTAVKWWSAAPVDGADCLLLTGLGLGSAIAVDCGRLLGAIVDSVGKHREVYHQVLPELVRKIAAQTCHSNTLQHAYNCCRKAAAVLSYTPPACRAGQLQKCSNSGRQRLIAPRGSASRTSGRSEITAPAPRHVQVCSGGGPSGGTAVFAAWRAQTAWPLLTMQPGSCRH